MDPPAFIARVRTLKQVGKGLMIEPSIGDEIGSQGWCFGFSASWPMHLETARLHDVVRVIVRQLERLFPLIYRGSAAPDQIQCSCD